MGVTPKDVDVDGIEHEVFCAGLGRRISFRGHEGDGIVRDGSVVRRAEVPKNQNQKTAAVLSAWKA
jgi:hypothetical protein